LCYPEASIDQTGKQSYPQDSFLPTCSNWTRQGMLHLNPISLYFSESELSENGKSLQQEESEDNLKRVEFIAEEGHVNDSSQLCRQYIY
jgi:hypothetical protein